MAEKKLARPVTVGGVTYQAGDTPTAEHAKLITNPKAYDQEAAAAVGNVSTGPTQQFVQTIAQAPRATAVKDEGGDDQPAKTTAGKAGTGGKPS